MADTNVETVQAVLSRIKETSSSNEKIKILKEFENDPLILTVLDFLYNDFIVTGLAMKKIDKEVGAIQNADIGTLLEAIEYLKKHNTGSDVDISNITHFIQNQPEEQHQFLKQVLTNTYKCGITAKSVNKALGNIIPEFACQLAHPYNKYPNLKGVFTLSTKLDGHRTIAIVNNIGETKFFTRKGKPIDGLGEVSSNIKDLANNCGILGTVDYNKGFVLDGEIVISNLDGVEKDKTFQETSKIIRKDGEKTGLTFNVFDMVKADEFLQGESKKTYQERRVDMERTFNKENYDNLELVKALYTGEDPEKINDILQEQLANGEEGIMINLDTPYRAKRHAGLLKVKEFYTDDLLVTGVYEGEKGSKYEGMLGGVYVDYKGNVVKVGSGFSDKEREEFFNDKDLIIGKVIEVQYFEETENQKDDGLSLRFPTYKQVYKMIRDDKDVEDVNIEK